jgi:SAM-dependent methyltransferase
VVREQRLVFGEVAELYDKARPTYPPPLIDHLGALAGPGGRALDVGCGTGKATVLLAERGLRGVGLEPDPEMAAVARRNLAPFPAWSVATGDFEEYGAGRPAGTGGAAAAAAAAGAAAAAAAGDFDLLTSAQAWHWLDPERRFQQAAQLLRSGGWLALFWNRTADDSSAVRRDVDAVYAELFPGLSHHGTLTAGRPPAGSPPADAGFDDPVWRVFPWVRRYTTSEWTDLAQTHSDHRMLAADQRRILLDRLSAVIDGHGGIYDHPYNCWLWTARRR